MPTQTSWDKGSVGVVFISVDMVSNCSVIYDELQHQYMLIFSGEGSVLHKKRYKPYKTTQHFAPGPALSACRSSSMRYWLQFLPAFTSLVWEINVTSRGPIYTTSINVLD